MCGTRSTTWDRFGEDTKDVVDSLVRDVPSLPDGFDVNTVAALVASIPRRKVGELADEQDDEPVAPYVGGHRNDIVTALRKSVRCACTDPVDRVYGLLGMTKAKASAFEPAKGTLSLTIDYNRSMARVFEDVARYVMKRESSASSILCLDARFGNTGLPSWVPDWQFPTSYKPFLYIEYLLRGKRIKASDDDEDNETPDSTHSSQIRFSDDSRIPAILPRSIENDKDGELVLHGRVIGTIVADVAPRIELDMTLLYRNKAHPGRKFKEPMIFDNDDHPASKVIDHLETASEELKQKYKTQLDSTGQCTLEFKIPGLRPIALKSTDLEIEQINRVDAPVADYNEHGTVFGDDKKDRLKLVQVQPADQTDVPLEAFLKCRYALKLLDTDAKAKAKAERKVAKKEEKRLQREKAKEEAKRRKEVTKRKKDGTKAGASQIEKEEKAKGRSTCKVSKKSDEATKSPDSKQAKQRTGLIKPLKPSTSKSKSKSSCAPKAKQTDSDGWETDNSNGSAADSRSDDDDEDSSDADSDLDSADIDSDSDDYNDSDSKPESSDDSFLTLDTSSDSSISIDSSGSSDRSKKDSDDSSPSSSDDDSGSDLAVASDEAFSDGSVQTSDPDDTYKYYSAPGLNALYNEHKCREFAVGQGVRVGDVLVVVEGCVLPVVLRPGAAAGAVASSADAPATPAAAATGSSGVSTYNFVSPALPSYRGTPTNAAAPQTWEYTLAQNFRPQRSLFAHWQVVLAMSIDAGTEDVFRVV